MASKVKTPAVDDQDTFLELPRKMTHRGRPAPRLEAHEADGLIEVTAEVPGVPESAIEVSVEDHVLTITVEKRDHNDGKHVHFSERWFGRFKRSIQLPFAPDPDSIEAAVEGGLLRISFPRTEPKRTRRIALRGAVPFEPEVEQGAIGADWPERSNTAEPLTLDLTATRLS